VNHETEVLLRHVETLAHLEGLKSDIEVRRQSIQCIGEAFDALIQAHIERGERLIDPETEAAIERRLHAIGGAA
jgi:hypothetical protein